MLAQRSVSQRLIPNELIFRTEATDPKERSGISSLVALLNIANDAALYFSGLGAVPTKYFPPMGVRADNHGMKIKQLVSLVVSVTALALSAVTTHAFGPPPPPPPMMGGGGPPFGGSGPPFRGEGAPFGGAGPRFGDGPFRGPRPARPSNLSGRDKGLASSRPRNAAAQRQSLASRSRASAEGEYSNVNRSGNSSAARGERTERGNSAGNKAERSNGAEGSSSAQGSNNAERSNSGSRNSNAEGNSETRSERSDSHGHNAERYNAEDWHRDWDRHHGHYYNGRYYLYEDGYWYGTDYGYSYDSGSDSSADADSNDYNSNSSNSNGSNSNGSKSNTNYDVGSTYTVTPDPTVLAVQTRLTHLGYYNGPVDGIYGPTTRDAVANYQVAANLTVTGTLSAETLKLLALPQVTQR